MKLVTYNIFHGRYWDKAADFLQEEKAEIVCLQEVGRKSINFQPSEVDMIEDVAKKLNYVYSYSHMFYGDSGTGTYEMGVVILSKFRILETIEFKYERASTDEILEANVKDRYNLPRKLLGVKLDLVGRELWVFTTHFTITPNALPTDQQIKEAIKVKAFLADYDEFVLCGDMNAAYRTETYRILSEGMVDVSLGEEPTLHQTLHRVGHLKHHVDYVFYKGNNLKHVSSKIPMVDGSDHLPIVVEFEL